MDPFDLIEFQEKARETCDPKKLFELWEDVCRRYERQEIGAYEVEEMKEIIWPALTQLASLRRSVNGLPNQAKKSKFARRRKIS